jgi:hypothetical protein
LIAWYIAIATCIAKEWVTGALWQAQSRLVLKVLNGYVELSSYIIVL